MAYVEHPYEPRSRAIHRSMSLACKPLELYRFVSNPEGLAQWFCNRCLSTADGFHCEWDVRGTVDSIDCRIIRSSPPLGPGEPGQFHFRWESATKGYDTLCSFEISEDGDGSRLSFIETGFGDGPEWDAGILEESEGWDSCFGNLREVAGSGERNPIVAAVTLPIIAETLWGLVTDPERLARWFPHTCEPDVRLGGRWTMDSQTDTPSHGWIERLKPGELISFTWSLYEDRSLPPTAVTFALSTAADGISLSVTHSGWGLDGCWDAEYDDHAGGWPHVLEYLRSHLELAAADG